MSGQRPRRLFLLRHAKAVPPAGRDDFQRELAPRGRADAARVGLRLAADERPPQVAFHSGAARAEQTAAIALQALSAGIEAREDPLIYEASLATLERLVRRLPDAFASILLVGHNPGFGELAVALCGRGDFRAQAMMAKKFPTAGLAVIDFSAPSWADATPGAGTLQEFLSPAMLGERDD